MTRLFRRQTLLLIAVLVVPRLASAQTGTVTGTVTDGSTGLPIANATVQVMTYALQTVGSAQTNGAGQYTVAGVPPGALYYVRAGAAAGYVDAFYPGVRMYRNSSSQTRLAEATPIAVAGGATISGIDFALDREGRITGTVTDASAGGPVAGVTVLAYAPSDVGAQFAGQAVSDGSGTFAIGSLPAGRYYLATSNNAGLQNEIHDNIPCPTFCSPLAAVASGTPVQVGAGETAAGRDFALAPAGRISGRVTNATTGAPVPFVSVQAITLVGTSQFSAGGSTDADGHYTIQGLSAGAYAVYTSASTLTNQIHGGILCPLTCSSTVAANSGVRVPVALAATTTGIDFNLDAGGTITGTVTNEVTGLPAAGVSVIAVVQLGFQPFLRAASTDASGTYVLPGLPTATYFLFTGSSSFVNEIYDDIPCSAFCSNVTAVASGTPVPVTSGATTAGRDFALQPLAGGSSGSISGVVTDAASGLPIAGVEVRVMYEVAGGSVETSVNSDLTGAYGVQGLSPGTYYVFTTGNHTFRNEVFDDVPCLGTFCPNDTVLTGTPVVLGEGDAATASFALSKADGLTGTVTDADTGLPLAGVTVQVYQSPSGTLAGSATTNTAGIYFVRGLPNGTYVAFTSNALGYRDEIFDDLPCASFCSVATAIASGTPIVVTGADAFVGGVLLVGGIDVALNTREAPPPAPTNLRIVTASGTAMFTWTAPFLFNGGAPTSYLIEAGGTPGATFITLPIAGTPTAFAVPGVPPGTYYVRLRAINAFGAGPPSNEVRLVVGAGGTGLPDTPTSVVAFMSGGRLTMTWAPALTGGPASTFIVEAGSFSGASNIATVVVGNAAFSYSPVPPGFYFLRVRARNAAGVSAASTEVMVVVGNAPAPPGAPTFTSYSAAAGTVTLNWQAPAQGTPTSYIVEAGSAPGLANLAVANTASAALTVTFTGVPSGTYYVRLRAVNAIGASVVSNERAVTVP